MYYIGISYEGKYDHRGKWSNEFENGPFETERKAKKFLKCQMDRMSEWYTPEQMKGRVFFR